MPVCAMIYGRRQRHQALDLVGRKLGLNVPRGMASSKESVISARKTRQRRAGLYTKGLKKVSNRSQPRHVLMKMPWPSRNRCRGKPRTDTCISSVLVSLGYCGRLMAKRLQWKTASGADGKKSSFVQTLVGKFYTGADQC